MAMETLAGGGEMGALMRSIDWARTPVGPVETWPQPLRLVLRLILSAEKAFFALWGPEHVQFYNDGYRPILGSTKHPLSMGRSARESWSEIWDVVGPMLDGVLAGGSTHTKDGLLVLDRHGFLEECYFDYAYTPIRDEAGAVGGVFGTVTETTGRILGERRLALLRELSTGMAQERELESCLRSIEAVLSGGARDVSFALLYQVRGDDCALVACVGVARGSRAAPAKVKIATGSPWPLATVVRSRREVLVDDLGERFGALVAGAWPDPVRSALALPLFTGSEGEATFVLVAGLSPRLRPCDEYMSFVQLLARQVASGLAAVRAFELERRRASDLAELDRAKTAFFSNVSHEFRTPLTLILSPVQEALSVEDGALSGTRLDLVRRNALRLQKLVDSLLDYSRVEAGRAEARYRPTELGALTTDLASAFRSIAERAGLTLTAECPPLAVPVFVDVDMYEKIVLNLLSNAFKFTLRGGIRVSLAVAGGSAVLTVADTGVGIPVADVPHIFERFRRVHGSQGRSFEGSGIGLALVQELVQLHGGSVSAESRLGEGTRFTVSLPLGPSHLDPERVERGAAHAPGGAGALPFLEEAAQWLPDAPPPATAGSAPRREADAAGPVAGACERVLLADDNADMRAYLDSLLRARGWDVEAVSDGDAALLSARKRPPDLVLTDVMMPGLDGFGLLRALRADEATRAVPVILISARADEAASIEGMQRGADDYLVKPFTAKELVSRVAARLEIARVRAAAVAQEKALRSEVSAEQERARLRVAALVEELQLADRRKDEFIAMLAHELRNPLAAISMALFLLDAAPGDAAWTAPHREVARRQTKKVARLVDDLLDVARISRGKTELRREDVDLAAIVRDAVAAAQSAIEARAHELTVAVAPGAFPLHADPMRLEQVVDNLLQNAAKYTEPGGAISVRLERDETRGPAHALLRVSDTGRGIPADVVGRVFDKFVQVSPSIDRRMGGLGLGLTLVKTLVELHGGSAWARSEGLGRGSEFFVRLPLSKAVPVPAPAQGSADGRAPAPEACIRSKIIVLVEDCDDLREVLGAHLSGLGNQITVEGDGITGAARILELRPDVSLVDIGLPGIDGYEVARRVRAAPGGDRLYLVALTGYGSSADRALSKDAGFDLHLTKPLDMEELTRALLRSSDRPAHRGAPRGPVVGDAAVGGITRGGTARG